MAKKQIKDPEKGLENVEGALNSTESFIEENQNLISWILLAIIVIIFGIIAFNKYYVRPHSEEASYELSKAEYFFGEGNYQTALEGDGAECIGFEGVIDGYKRTDAGRIAKYYAGVSCYKLGKYDEAADYLKSFSCDNEILNLEAELLLGDVYVELDDVQTAFKQFEKVAKKNNQILSPRALLKAGIAYESLQNKEAALKAYQTIKDDFNSSDEAREIDKYIARVK